MDTRGTATVSDTMTWPDEHVAWQGVIEAIPTHSVPFGVHVFLMHEREQLRAACGDPHASAWSSTYDELDANDIGAIMLFSVEDLELALAAHEAAHVALNHAAAIETTRVGARRWLNGHPEWVAEMIGNLTVLVWTAIYEHEADNG
jgi:hypothetical protein